MHLHASEAPRLRPDISLQLLDDAGILFRAGTQQLFALNTAATYIWCQLEEGLSAAQIVPGLARTCGLSRDEAAACVDGILQQWRELGLIEDTAAGEDRRRSPPSLRAGDYRLLDSRFRLLVPGSQWLDDLVPVLAPLAEGAGEAPLLTLTLMRSNGGYELHCGDRVVESCDRREQVVPMVKTALIQLAFEHSRDFCALHAAGIRLHDHCLLLPGESGSGKSTLTAAMVAAGLPLLGDDTVVLTEDGMQARSVPFAICLKPGSWPLLQAAFPHLEQLPVHHRLDGKQARYLVPPDPGWRVDQDTRLPVRWMVFPCYRPGSDAELRPVTRPEALNRLVAQYCPLGGDLDPGRVARLVAWIGRLDCYELHYDRLGEAVALLRRLAP